MYKTTAVRYWTATGRGETWQSTTLDKLDKKEDFLEGILAESPELLGLQSRRSGIHGPIEVFQQLAMLTPVGRQIYPDIVLLAASGHVIVVEVKLASNPELRDRAVIAQIIDYASSFAALKEEDLLALFRRPGSAAETWAELVQELFPQDDRPDELAEVLLTRSNTGELNLVIACDRVPLGLPEIVEGIASQKTLGFDVVLLDWPQSERPSGDVTSSLGTLENWNTPLVLLGSAGLLQAKAWSVIGSAG